MGGDADRPHGPGRAGRMPRPSCRWPSTSRTAAPRCSSGSSTACAAGSRTCGAARATASCCPTEPFQYGDWLDPDAPAARPWEAKVSSDYVANAFYVHSARLLARAERLVGDAGRRGGRRRARRRRRRRDVGAVGRGGGDDADRRRARARVRHRARDERRAAIADGLAANVARATTAASRPASSARPLVLFALSHNGHLAEAYLMLLRHDAPSWLYQVDRGATTVWERWDAILPGRLDPRRRHGRRQSGGESGGMLSFNHYAYGAMIDWVYRTVAGLAPDAEDPGYRTVHVAPRPAAGLDHAAATIATGLGELAIDWRLSRATRSRRPSTVPFGARAVLDLPVTEASVVTVDGAERSRRAAPRHPPHPRHRTGRRVSAVPVTEHHQKENPVATPVVSRVSTDAPYGSDTVPSPAPRLGWITETDAPDWAQASAELQLDAPHGRGDAHGRRQGIDAGALAVRALGAAGGGDAARARDRRRRGSERVERAPAHLRRLPRRRRVDGRGHRARGPRGARAARVPAHRVRRRGGGRPRHSLRDGGGRLPGGGERHGCRRPGHEARLDAVPGAHDPRDDGRHGPARRRGAMPSASASPARGRRSTSGSATTRTRTTASSRRSRPSC